MGITVKYERLIARIPAPRSKLGVSTQDIERIIAVPELSEELKECLRSEDDPILSLGYTSPGAFDCERISARWRVRRCPKLPR
jgi:hypothetical protein